MGDAIGLSYEISNVKCHFKIGKEIKITCRKERNIRRFQNFFVWKKSQFTFIVFEKAGVINITGCKNFFEDPFKAFQIFCENFVDLHQPALKYTHKIDCSTISGKIPNCSSINLFDLKPYSDCIKISIRPHYFSSAVIRRKEEPTILIFSTGSFIILGSKEDSQITESIKVIQKILHGMHA